MFRTRQQQGSADPGRAGSKGCMRRAFAETQIHVECLLSDNGQIDPLHSPDPRRPHQGIEFKAVSITSSSSSSLPAFASQNLDRPTDNPAANSLTCLHKTPAPVLPLAHPRAHQTVRPRKPKGPKRQVRLGQSRNSHRYASAEAKPCSQQRQPNPRTRLFSTTTCSHLSRLGPSMIQTPGRAPPPLSHFFRGPLHTVPPPMSSL